MPLGTARCSAPPWKWEHPAWALPWFSKSHLKPYGQQGWGSLLPRECRVQARTRKLNGHQAVPLRLPCSLVTPLPPPESTVAPGLSLGGFPCC